jgi:hypothetical protein
MEIAPIGPGDDVEAWCTRCRMDLNHRVIAVVGKNVKKVQCLTCGSDHKYHPPRNEGPEEKESPPKRTQAFGRTSAKIDRGAGRARGEWATFMKEMPPDSTPKPYRMSESYKPGEFLTHPTFGTGRVSEILGVEKIEVVFEEGRKVLLANRKKD